VTEHLRAQAALLLLKQLEGKRKLARERSNRRGARAREAGAGGELLAITSKPSAIDGYR